MPAGGGIGVGYVIDSFLATLGSGAVWHYKVDSSGNNVLRH